MAKNAVFNGNNLQTFDGTSGILVSLIDHLTPPQADMTVYPVAHGNVSEIPFKDHTTRKVVITGKVIAQSIASCESLIDTLKGYLTGRKQNLDIDYAGGTRRYIATYSPGDSSFNQPNNLNFASFTLVFFCTVPFGMDATTTTAASDSAATTASKAYNHTFVGTAPYQLPVFTFTFTSVTGAAGKYVQISNGANGQSLYITRTWASGDVLVIDCVAKKVTVNGVEVDFSGAFPEFAVGAGTIQYADTFTTRSYNLSAVYNARYM